MSSSEASTWASSLVSTWAELELLLDDELLLELLEDELLLELELLELLLELLELSDFVSRSASASISVLI